MSNLSRARVRRRTIGVTFTRGDIKERGLFFATNYQNIGNIEFDEDSIESKTVELLKELIGFGLVRIAPA
jgi:hypothetical protein